MAKRLSTQLFVSRLSAYSTNQTLEKLFSQFGVVREARLIRDLRTGKPKGFGFVTFDKESEALKAMKTMNGRMVDGGLIFVEVAKSSKPEDDATSSTTS